MKAPGTTAPGTTAPGTTAPGTTAKSGKFSKRDKDLPDKLQVRFKAGVLEVLDRVAIERGFNDRSDLTRAAFEYVLAHDDFKKGWDK